MKPCVQFLLIVALTSGLGAQQKPAPQSAPPPKMEGVVRDKLHMMLLLTHDEVRKQYYDPRYHGVDIDALYKKLDAMLDKVQTLNEGYLVVASFTQALHDSHTVFVPPVRTYRSNSGFELTMIGDECFITQVRPETDAATKLHPGDQVLAYNGYKVERNSFDAMMYSFNRLMTTQVSELYLRAPDGTARHELVQHRLIKGSRIRDYTASNGNMNYWDDVRKDEADDKLQDARLVELGDVIVWKQEKFNLSDTKVASAFAQWVNKHKTLVLDLRGNGGGDADMMKFMIGMLVDHDVTVATLQARKPEKPMIAKTVKGHVYPGKVIVLLDSRSGSASELLARVMQIEHRATVLGDRSSGGVMEAKMFPERIGVDTVTPFLLEITFANLVMTDGKSLEGVGVEPDEKMLPTAEDLAAGRDPVLARAINEGGDSMTPEKAGKLFPYRWAVINTD